MENLVKMKDLEIDPGDKEVKSRVWNRIDSETKDRLSEAIHRLLRRRPLVSDL